MKKIFYCLFISAVMLLLLCTAVYADGTTVVTGNCGEGVFWEYDPESETLKIYGDGVMEDYTSDYSTVYAPWHSYAGSAKHIMLEEGITHIGARAFYGFDNIKEITVPASVKTIGLSALPITSLEKISVHPDSEYYEADEYGVLYRKGFTKLVKFPKMLKLKAYRIPDCTTYIYQAAFSGATYLEFVDIGDGVLTIDQGAFWNCPKLRSVRVGNSVKVIEYAAFFLCGNLTNVKLGNGVTYISNAAFEHTGLTSIVIPESVEALEDAFYGAPLEHIYVMNPNMKFRDDPIRNNPNTVIHGYLGSTAQEYADAQGLAFTQLLPEPTLRLVLNLLTSIFQHRKG